MILESGFRLHDHPSRKLLLLLGVNDKTQKNVAAISLQRVKESILVMAEAQPHAQNIALDLLHLARLSFSSVHAPDQLNHGRPHVHSQLVQLFADYLPASISLKETP